MTDKEIIIDGVNVAGCDKQGETQAGITCGTPEKIRFGNEYVYKHTLCKDNSNCLYKQLQRKEQECEELKNSADFWGRTTAKQKQKQKADRYKQALKEIKEIIKEFYNNNLCFYENIDDCQSCDMQTNCNYLRKLKILTIINEVKDE